MLMAMSGVLKLVLAIATGLLWLVEIVDYYIYRLIGCEGFCASERDPLFRWLVKHMGAWAFLLMGILTPFVIAGVMAITPAGYEQLTCGAVMGVGIAILLSDLQDLRTLLTELKIEEAFNGPEFDFTTITVPEEHKQRYCNRLKCERISSFRWLGGNWICCGIARAPSKPGDVMITCQGVVRDDKKLAVLMIEQRPYEAALMLKAINDALAYYLNEEALKKYGYKIEEGKNC